MNEQEPKTYSAMAITGFVLSLIFAPVGLVISIVSLVKIKASGKLGRGLSIAGVIIGAISTVIGILSLAVVAPMIVSQAQKDNNALTSNEVSIDSNRLSAEYVASIPESGLDNIDTKTVEVRANRGIYGDSVDNTILMTIPDAWTYDASRSVTHYDGDGLYMADLPSGLGAYYGAYTIAGIEGGSRGALSTSWLDTEDIVELYTASYGEFSSGADTTIFGKNAYVGITTEPGANAVVVTFIVSEDNGSFSDVAFIADVTIPLQATEADFVYVVGLAKSSLATAIEYDLEHV